MKARGTSALAATILLGLLAPGPAVEAAQARSYSPDARELQSGEAQGIAVSSSGRLSLAPRISRLGTGDGNAGAAQVWSVTSDGKNNTYLGTGPDGQILKISPGGAESVLFTAGEPIVTALTVLDDGSVLAGTSPGGKIYRIRPDGKGEVWCETHERYVWSLAVGPGGDVYAATGERGVLFRIGGGGRAETLFDSDETHLTALALDPRSGGVLVGGAGRGLVYRVDPKGRATVILDSDLSEVAELAFEPDGAVVAATVASPETEPRPPAVRFQLPAAPPARDGPDSVGGIDERAAGAIEGVIEGLGQPESRGGRRLRGQIVRIASDGAVEELWRSSTETPLALAVAPDGLPVFGTGEPARIYRVRDRDEIELLATLREGQVTSLVRAGAALVAATSNPASAYRVEQTPEESGVFTSRPFDASTLARWGAMRWSVDGAAGPVAGIEVEARSGNSAEPDGTWSAFSAAVTTPDGTGPMAVPSGRYFQWRVRLTGQAASKVGVRAVAVRYAARNRPPIIEGFRIEGAPEATAGTLAFRWSASDPDGDPVSLDVLFRDFSGGEWKSAARSDPGSPSSSGSDTDDGWKEGKASWDTASIPEGEIEIRAVASDRGANAPDEGTEIVAASGVRITVDRTAPLVELRRLADGSLEVSATDATSAIRRAEVLEGERTLFSPRATDGVSDSRRETFRLTPDQAGPSGTRTVRIFDAAGNATTRDVPTR